MLEKAGVRCTRYIIAPSTRNSAVVLLGFSIFDDLLGSTVSHDELTETLVELLLSCLAVRPRLLFHKYCRLKVVCGECHFQQMFSSVRQRLRLR